VKNQGADMEYFLIGRLFPLFYQLFAKVMRGLKRMPNELRKEIFFLLILFDIKLLKWEIFEASAV